MSEDTKDDKLMLPEEQDLASTGAAADSAEPDEKLKALPRLLRYAILSTKDGSFAQERLIAEITALAPSVPLTLVWAQGTPSDGTALAIQLDHLAVTTDQPDLRSISDCVRLLSLAIADLIPGSDDHLRVGKALIHAYHQLPADLDIDLAADIETFVAGWAALPSAATVLSRYVGGGAAEHARVVGRRLATHRVDAAEEKLSKRYREREQEKREAAAPGDPGAIKAWTATSSVADDHLIVCKLDEAAMKNPKMRELITPFKGVISTQLPLIPVPPLHKVRAQLLFEFPYAEAVIDFALTDLVGRRTLLLRPLLVVGDAGGGKSRFARRLGETLGLGVWRTDASRSDGAVFSGTDNLRKLARIDRSVLPSTASCKFVGNPPSNLARGLISDQVGMAATGWVYTPSDIINRQAMRANLLAKATATNFGGFRYEIGDVHAHRLPPALEFL